MKIDNFCEIAISDKTINFKGQKNPDLIRTPSHPFNS